MKFAALIAASSFLLGIGNLAEGPTADYANFTAVMVLSSLLVWIVCKGLPAIHAAHRDERDALLARLDALEARRHEDTVLLRETLDKIVSHCMRQP